MRLVACTGLGWALGMALAITIIVATHVQGFIAGELLGGGLSLVGIAAGGSLGIMLERRLHRL